MKTVTLNQYLEQLAEFPPDLASQRDRLQKARAAIAQCLAQGGYLSRTRDSLPHFKAPSRGTHARLRQWWVEFDTWLQSLGRREQRCLAREIVPAVEEDFSGPPGATRKTRKATRIPALV